MTYGDEIRRKAIHLGSAIFPLIYWLTDQRTMFWILVPLVAFALIVETARQFSPSVQQVVHRLLGSILRIEEKRLFTGATYVVISCLIMIAFFPKGIAIATLLFMSISDALASLVGQRVPSARFLGKSVAGSSAFFLSAAAIAAWQLPHALIVGLCGAVAATLAEAASLRWGAMKIDDNLAIPVAGGSVMLLLQAYGV
ncbi:MAG: phosphatidate cytidylyltransferase [Planctomycetes bacterium]|nr:phosphatidate cytidylyltransferase [Planctomycetota bacterium]